MKKVLFFAMAALMCMSCASKKAVTPQAQAVQSTITTEQTLEGDQVRVETIQLQGIAMEDALNEDGTGIVKVAYKWFAGMAKANDKQTAVEIAQREAYATISQVLNQAVKAEAERGTVAPNGNVQKAIKSHWEQFSASLMNACEPFGAARIEFDQTTRMYNVTAKVAVRGDKFNQMLKTAGAFRPQGLNQEEMQQFIEINDAIMNAARSGK